MPRATFDNRGRPLGLTGATAATRYVGATTSGAPGSGTFAVGDYVIDQTGGLFVCTAAGSPGTWAASSGSLSGVTVTGTAASGQVPVASSSSAGAWAYPPGFEINYTQITSPANITDTAESTATALISPGAITFDGTAVICEFFGVVFMDTAAVGDLIVITLFEGATQITRLAAARADQTTNQDLHTIYAAYRFTPTAASHTYKLCAFTASTTGTPKINAGAAGTNGYPPAFVRFVKV